MNFTADSSVALLDTSLALASTSSFPTLASTTLYDTTNWTSLSLPAASDHSPRHALHHDLNLGGTPLVMTAEDQINLLAMAPTQLPFDMNVSIPMEPSKYTPSGAFVSCSQGQIVPSPVPLRQAFRTGPRTHQNNLHIPPDCQLQQKAVPPLSLPLKSRSAKPTLLPLVATARSVSTKCLASRLSSKRPRLSGTSGRCAVPNSRARSKHSVRSCVRKSNLCLMVSHLSLMFSFSERW